MSGSKRPIAAQDIHQFLTESFSPNVRDVALLGSGSWSNAYSFELGDEQLVFKLGHFYEDFAKEQIAAEFNQPGLPVPRFYELGEAFDQFYAITERAYGTYLDDLPKHSMKEVLPALFTAIDSLRFVSTENTAGFGIWNHIGVAEHETWHQALLAVDQERPRVAGWRDRLATWPECQTMFDQCVNELRALVQYVPDGDELDVVHSDLLNRNVLVANHKPQLNAVFDWGCSLFGDFLYDIAWLTFWAPDTPGLATLDVYSAANVYFHDVDDFDVRVRCYEIHIGLESLVYNTFMGRRELAHQIAARTLAIATHR